MDAHVAPEAHAGDQGDARDQLATGADHAVFANHAAGTNACTGGNVTACADADMWADAGAGVNLRRYIHDGAGVDARRHGRPIFKQCGNFCVGHIRVVCDQHAASKVADVRFPHDHHPGLGGGQLGAVAWVGQKPQLCRTGVSQGADARHLAIFSAQRKPKTLCQLGGAEGSYRHTGCNTYSWPPKLNCKRSI